VFTFFVLISIVGGSQFFRVRLMLQKYFFKSFYVVYSATQFSLEVYDMFVTAFSWTEFFFIKLLCLLLNFHRWRVFKRRRGRLPDRV
jgi:hypothetical protein